MRLTSLQLTSFRNYGTLALDPQPGINAFVGPNAQGKSNLLEAIAMLGTGKSFRTTHDADAVAYGAESAIVRGDAEVRAGAVTLACSIAKGPGPTRKTYTFNGRNVRYAGYLGKLRVVTFVPSDLMLAVGPPNLRRGFLNAALSQEDSNYYRALTRYRKALQQKNALLRADDQMDPELLAVYDAALIESGTQIVLARERFVRELGDAATAAHARFTEGSETLDVAYEPSVTFERADAESVADALASKLRQVAERERIRKASLVGPHRDDLSVALDGKSLAAYGSQGQQRTAVLALKIAEYAVASARAGEAPLLLLDDVLSELDERRSAAFLAGIGDYEQAFVTATHVPSNLAGRAWLYGVRDAVVSPRRAAS